MKRLIRFDEYYLVERVAVGGMAEVFKGVTYSDEGFERQMAVKRVLPHIAEDQDFIEMFIDEAKLVSQLQHPNIPQVYHLGKFEEQYFISMEFISGQDLRSLFDRSKQQKTPLDLGVCAHVIMEVCEALDYAHRKTNDQLQPLHLIHRDVSPQNIILSYDGQVKLIDFGIAKAVGKINQTQAGILKGKFSYMSPEQARGYKIDARSDLFGLGAVLYELITSERCFLGQSDFSTIERVRNTEYTLPRKIRREIPPQLEKIVRKALAKDPNDRFQSAADFQEALRVFVRTHQLQRSREQLKEQIAAYFSAEIADEYQRMEQFRAYAAEHIPEAQRSGDSRRHQVSQRPRFALDNQIKLSLDAQDQSEQGMDHNYPAYTESSARSVKMPFFTMATLSRLGLLVTLAILTGSILAAVSWVKKPLKSFVVFETPHGLRSSYTLNGPGGLFRGSAPSIVELTQGGLYQLEIKRANEETLERELQIVAGQTIKVTAAPISEDNKRLLVISTEPSDAEVYLDGVKLGRSPLNKEIKAGVGELSVRYQGYLDVSDRISFTRSEQSIEKHYRLKPKRVESLFEVNVEGASVELEDPPRSKRFTSVVANRSKVLLDNRIAHLVKIKAPGYRENTFMIEPENRERVIHRVVLETLESTAEVYTPSPMLLDQLSPPSVLTVAEPKEDTHSKPSVQEEPMSEGESQPIAPKPQVKARQKSKRSSSARPRSPQAKPTVSPPRRKPRAEPKKADAQPGFLKLIAIPPAEAFIDGKSVGWTPLINFKLLEGVHQIKLRFQSGEERTITQAISAGRVSLRRVKK